MTFPFDKFKQGLLHCGLTENDFESKWADFTVRNEKTEQAGKRFIWITLTQLLVDTTQLYVRAPRTLYSKLQSIYREMVIFLVYEKKDPVAVIKLIHRCTLKGYSTRGLEMNVEVFAGSRCIQAKIIEGRRFPLEAVLKHGILPYPKCRRTGGCNCFYGGIVVVNKKGNRVLRKY